MSIQLYNTSLNSLASHLFDNFSTNSSNEKPEGERTVYNLYDTFLVITGFITFAINALVFYLFTSKHYLKTATNYILLSLAASDMLAGVLVVPLYISCVITFSPIVCVYFDIFQRVVAITNIYHLAAVTGERYITIIYPLRSPRLMTKRRICFAIGALWFASLFISLVQGVWIHSCPYELTFNSDCYADEELVYDIICVVIIFFLPLFSMLYADIRMLRVVIKQSKMINKQHSSSQRGKSTNHYRAVITFTIMLGSFTLCWSMFFILPAVRSMNFTFPQWLDDAQFFLRFCSPFINPIIYIFVKHDFKRAFGGLIWRRIAGNYTSSTALGDTRGSTSMMMRRRGP